MRSSDVRALADDARKDEDNVAFLAALPLASQGEWLMRLRWLRVADRLAENGLVEPGAWRFEAFVADFRAMAECGVIGGEHAAIWHEMRSAFWTPSGEARDPRALVAWSEYLAGLSSYSRADLRLDSVGEHDRMLKRLSGAVFGVFPYLRPSQRCAATRLGMLDQAMNNLRDIAEDAAHGLCFFPSDVLDRFDVSRASILDGSAVGTPQLRAMMRFWLDGPIARRRRGAASFLTRRDLHPSLERLRDSCARRYARIEDVLRACDFDYVAFPEHYWLAARRDRDVRAA